MEQFTDVRAPAGGGAGRQRAPAGGGAGDGAARVPGGGAAARAAAGRRAAAAAARARLAQVQRLAPYVESKFYLYLLFL